MQYGLTFKGKVALISFFAISNIAFAIFSPVFFLTLAYLTLSLFFVTRFLILG